MDDGSTIRYFILLFFLLLGGAYFAGTEISLAGVNRIRIMSYADDGNERAKRVLYILGNFDQALTTILIGNNLVHIGFAALLTYMVTRLWGTGAVAYSTIVSTVVVFLFAEMIPKYFAKTFNERFALTVAGSLIFLMKIMLPVSFLFTRITRLLSSPFTRHKVEEPTITEDELQEIVDTIAQEGVLDEEKSELVQSALEFAWQTTQDILIPWSDVLTVSTLMPEEEIIKTIKGNTPSRLPVLDINGNVIGVLQIRKYLKAYIKKQPGESLRLRSIMDDVSFVRSDTPIDDLLPEMSKNKTHLSVVLDTEGKTLGILTVEDILEELVGEIYDEEDTVTEEDTIATEEGDEENG